MLLWLKALGLSRLHFCWSLSACDSVWQRGRKQKVWQQCEVSAEQETSPFLQLLCLLFSTGLAACLCSVLLSTVLDTVLPFSVLCLPLLCLVHGWSVVHCSNPIFTKSPAKLHFISSGLTLRGWLEVMHYQLDISDCRRADAETMRRFENRSLLRYFCVRFLHVLPARHTF